MSRRILAAAVLLAAAACSKEPAGYDPTRAFKDDAQTNVAVTPDQFALSFVDTAGQTVDLADFRGKKPVVLVVMRGFTGMVCLYCSAQTARLITNHKEFVKRGAEVLVVYPGPKEHVPTFLTRAREEADRAAVPFRVLLDPDFAAVDKLGIRGQLAKPSTYILDKQGQVRFAYVGASLSDRPSLKAMLAQLDQLNSGE
jgi:peroxiredoxin